MWVLKTKEEYKEYRQKKFKESATGAFYISLITVFITSIMSKYGCRGRNPHQYELSWNQVFDEIPADLILVLFFTIIFTLLSYFIGDWKKICNKCSKEKDKIWNDNCSCGGKFIHEKKFNWISEGKKEKEKNPVYDQIKNINWNDFKKKYNLQITDFIFNGLTLDVPEKLKFSNPNLFLVIKNIIELTTESSYLQIIKQNKSYLQITLNSDNNFILVYHENKSYLVESSRDMKLFDIIEALSLYHNDFKKFEQQFNWIALVNTVS